ncbi:zinc finger BED domain-containing protein 4-like [Pieris napi]|uniref:zinc finger BED domain-containing protein 4-like n=1 Tax=Pieris napi TaxID=78633 RepID=UPI001FB97109|nr:zinc finger BED domain-containing protein 4-like [Pieris napi]
MQTALPNYQLRGRQFFTEHICDEIFTKIATKIGQSLKHFLKLSFTTDIWSEPSANVSLLSLTAHGITEDFTRKQIVLKCCSLHGRHTGDIICDYFKMMLRDWNIQNEQLHCFIRDGGSNMVRAMHLAEIPDINCTVHQLQLSVRSALDEIQVKDLLAKCRKISGHFNHSQIAQDELIKIQTEQLNQPALRVIQVCVTRWNSTYYMAERLLKVKDSICLYASKHSIPQISPEEWLYLNKLVAILTPFEEITRNLSDTNTCISSVIPMIHVLKHTLQMEKEKIDTNPNFKNIIQKLIEDINSRFCDLQSNTLYSLATYLDPRYKLKFFNDVIKEQVQSELIRLLTLYDSNVASRVDDDEPSVAKRARLASNASNVDPSTSFEILSPIQSVHSNLADMLKNCSDEEESENDSMDTNSNLMIWKTLINEYNKENRLQLNEDPLLWWRYNIKYKVFAPIVRIYLSAPPSSVPSEQLFSAAGLIYEPLRNRLEGEKAAKLLFVKYNLPLVNFDY